MLWKFAGTSAYLQPSVHALKEPAVLSENSRAAIEAARILVFENDLIRPQPADMGHIHDGRRLSRKLAPQIYLPLQKLWAEVGLPSVKLDTAEPLFAQITLARALMARRGYSADHGIDGAVLALGHPERQSLVHLEDFSAVLARSNEVPQQEQLASIEHLVLHTERSLGEREALAEAFVSEDIDRIEGICHQAEARFPSLHRFMVTDRTRAWLPGITRVVGTGAPAIITVPALHFVGDEGLLQLLPANGLAVERVD